MHEENDTYYAVEKLTPKLWRRRMKDGSGAYYMHWCPGCKHAHTYPVGSRSAPNWNFDGNIEAPSFTPSMLIFRPAHNDGEFNHPQESICHYYLTAGVINYQNDCRHELAGKQGVDPGAISDDYGW